MCVFGPFQRLNVPQFEDEFFRQAEPSSSSRVVPPQENELDKFIYQPEVLQEPTDWSNELDEQVQPIQIFHHTELEWSDDPHDTRYGPVVHRIIESEKDHTDELIFDYKNSKVYINGEAWNIETYYWKGPKTDLCSMI